MNRKLITSSVMVGLLALRAGAASDFYVNDSVVMVPPQIAPQVSATNFVNNNYFNINFTNLTVWPNGAITIAPAYYSTADTRNFTNNSVMMANGGFVFDWFDTVPVMKTHKWANNFVNQGTIAAGSGVNTNDFFGLFFVNLIPPKFQIAATNVYLRSSTNIVGVDGLFKLDGKKVDLNRANIMVEGFADTTDSDSSVFNLIDMPGMSSVYWGITNPTPLTMNPPVNLESATPFSPLHYVTTFGGGAAYRQLVLSSPAFYSTSTIIGTNRLIQSVFVNNTNAAIQNNVYFPFVGYSVVEWLGRSTNLVTGEVITNRMYLTDTDGTLQTNFLVQNFSYYTANGTASPANYTFTRNWPFLLTQRNPETPTTPAGLFTPNGAVTNIFTALGARFSPSTVSLSNLPPAARFLTNLPGRIEINAEETLDLRFARISGLNYMGLKATNHVNGINGATISVPYSDINLATTNGSLVISNLLAPVVQRFTGDVNLWTGRWTNDAGGFRNIYTVLMVDSQLSSTAPAQVQDLKLRSTNLVVSDILNVTRNLLLDTERLTITTNQQPAPTYRGEINLTSGAITWPGSLPRLRFLTNAGSITTLNSTFFGGSRTSPFFTSNYNESYEAFVNRGSVTTEGSQIWAKHFENTGQFSTGVGFGSISLLATNSILSNGLFHALKGSISIATERLVVTNHVLRAGTAMTLTATNLLTDLVTNAPTVAPFTNANNWTVGRGLNLPVKPAAGDLLGTVITDTAAPGVEVTHLWAAEDRGATNSAGFLNNAAIGKLILDGGNGASLFTFTGTGTSNALYVDYLELRNAATNIDLGGNLSLLNLDPNIVIYYAQAMAGTISVAERINHANGDRLRWVFNHAGNFSATNVVYPDGTTNFFNAALVQSQNLDSDGDGLVNAVDPTPILRAEDLGLTVAVTAQPTVGAVVSWNTVPDSANTVYYRTASSGSAWQVLTNVNNPPVAGRVKIFDPMSATGGRYYRVMMSPPQP
jgi:hypothetical protein